MNEVENIITKEVFETMCLIQIQKYHDILIVNVDINLMGNVKYIEGYNKDTQKKTLIAIHLEDCQEESWLEASEPGFDEYIIYSYTHTEIERLLEWFVEEIDVEDIPETLTLKILSIYQGN